MEDQNKVILPETSLKTIINLSGICRFCLSETKNDVNINDKCPSEDSKGFEEDSIYNFVTKLKFIKMEDNQSFPTQVCNNCFSLVRICKDFSQLCQKSDMLLRNYYENTLKETKPDSNNENMEYKVVIQMPNTQEEEVSVLNYNVEELSSNKSNKSARDDMIELDKNILQAYKQKLNLLSGKIKEVQTKLEINKKENTGAVFKANTHSCSNCSCKFSNFRALYFHTVVAHGQKRFKTFFKCKNCQKSFSDWTKLQRHYKIIHKISESEFSSSKNKEAVQGAEKFFCFYCNPQEKFQTQDELIEHLQLHKLNVSDSYSCAHCKDLTFSTKISLEEHISLVHKQNYVINNKNNESSQPQSQNLTDLSKFLNILDSVVDSLTIVQQKKEFKLFCKNCTPSVEFTSTTDFITHLNTHHDGSKLLNNWIIQTKANKNSSWNCSECPASFSRKQSLYCHLKEKHKEIILDGMKCPEPGCSKSFTTNRKLIQHGIIVHQKYFAYFHKVFKNVLQPKEEEEDNRVKNFECDICQKKYIYKTSLKKHIFDTHLEKSVKNPVVCSFCGKTLSSKLNLKSHIEFVHEALFVSCPICKKKINFRTIGKHYKTHKTTSDMDYSKNSFLCNLCGKILKSKRSFEDHQKLHKNIREELCDICGSGFTTKKFLRLHKKTHEGVQRKIFGCDQCDKVFRGRQTLNRHLLTHSGKKNFICEICSKCFYTLPELNRHVRHHKKEYRFDCQLCDMRFLDKSRFRHHMMRHRNVRPHKCQFCEKMFIVKWKMNLHMASKHNVEVQNTKGVWKDPKTYVPLDDLL